MLSHLQPIHACAETQWKTQLTGELRGPDHIGELKCACSGRACVGNLKDVKGLFGFQQAVLVLAVYDSGTIGIACNSPLRESSVCWR